MSDNFSKLVFRDNEVTRTKCYRMHHQMRSSGPITFDELCKGIAKIFESDEVCVDECEALLRSYISNAEDWKRFKFYDAAYKYTRNLVLTDARKRFNLMILCWGLQKESTIHDHHGSHCFMKILQGKLQEQQYRSPLETRGKTYSSEEAPIVDLELLSTTTYGKNEVAYIHDEIGLHRVRNPDHADTAVSLHLYVPAFDECNTFNDEELNNQGKVETKHVSFHTMFGELVLTENTTASPVHGAEN